MKQEILQETLCNTPIKAYSYIRFSTPDQINGDSLRRQITMAREYADKNALELQDVSFRDLGVSGFKGRNATDGSLGVFRELVRKGDISSDAWLLVEGWDRFSRMSPEDALQVMLEIIKLGVTIVTLKQGTVHRKGEMDVTKLLCCIIEMNQAHQFSVDLSRRVSNAKAAKRERIRETGQGRLVKICPAWIRPLGDDGFELIPERAEVVRQIYEWTLAGYGRGAILNKLRKDGIEPFGGKTWHQSYVQRILQNHQAYGAIQLHKVINGERKADGEPLKGYYPAVVTEEMYLAVRNISHKRRDSMPSHTSVTRKDRVIMFTNLFRCQCGETYRMINNGSYFYYKCRGVLQNSGCDALTMRKTPVERLLLTALSSFGEELLQAAQAINVEQTVNVNALKGKLNDVNQRIDVAVSRLLERNSDALSRALEELEDEARKLKVQVAEAEGNEGAKYRQTKSVMDLSELLDKLVDIAEDDANPDHRARFAYKLKDIVDWIHVREDRFDVHLKVALPAYFDNEVQRKVLTVYYQNGGRQWQTETIGCEDGERIFSSRKPEAVRMIAGETAPEVIA